MSYKMIVLDLDGTLTNSQKEITAPTREALIHIQQQGKKVVLASGRPTPGVLPLARELELEKYGSYILSYNGGHIRNCKTDEIIYNQLFPRDIIPAFYDAVKNYDVDIITYSKDAIISGICPNQYVELESRVCYLPIIRVDNFPEYIDFPINKLLISGEPNILEGLESLLVAKFGDRLNIYRSDPYFIDIMPPGINKASSLQTLLEHVGLTREEMICVGDGFNDKSMIEFAGLGVAMANAQPKVKEVANFITRSNDEDGVVYVIEQFMTE